MPRADRLGSGAPQAVQKAAPERITCRHCGQRPASSVTGYHVLAVLDQALLRRGSRVPAPLALQPPPGRQDDAGHSP